MAVATNTKKVNTRKKVAAAALALGMGVLGTGFAAGTITFNDLSGNHGFGSGQSQVQGGQIDITGQLTIDRPQTVSFTEANGYANNVDNNYTISGFGALSGANGATYHVAVKYTDTQSRWTEVKTGTVANNTTVTVPAKNQTDGTLKNVMVSLEK